MHLLTYFIFLVDDHLKEKLTLLSLSHHAPATTNHKIKTSLLEKGDNFS